MLQVFHSRPLLTGAFMIILGGAFAGLGFWLAVLGGSGYYSIAGMAYALSNAPARR